MEVGRLWQRRALWPMDADLEPHAGRVFVDWCARRCEWRLTHTTTYESIGVGAELACLAWTDEGFAYIVGGDGGDAAEKDVDEVFRWHLARSVGDGRLVVLEPPQQGDAQRPFYFLDSVRLEFEEKQFGFPLGCTGQQHKFALGIFARRRNGFRCFWSLSGVYKSLGFDMFSKCASRWAWQSLPRFEKSVSHLGSEQVLRSQCYQDPGPDASLEDRSVPSLPCRQHPRHAVVADAVGHPHHPPWRLEAVQTQASGRGVLHRIGCSSLPPWGADGRLVGGRHVRVAVAEAVGGRPPFHHDDIGP